MYAYIKGTVKTIEPTYIVVDNYDIGYLIITPNPYRFKLEEVVLVYLHHYVRDDIDNLYGFLTEAERDLFIKLIGVSGIGPKSALSILASGEPEKITYAIENEDVKYLKQHPGIGPKSAQQIILDLKGKLAKVTIELDETADEAKLALLSLGFNNTEINRALKKITNDLSIEETIKQALSLLIK